MVARRAAWLLSRAAVLAVLGTACAKRRVVDELPAPVAGPVVVSAPVTSPTTSPTTSPLTWSSLAVIPVRVTYVLRALRPSLDSLFAARDSLNTPQCANAGGLFCHQYVYQRDSLELRASEDHLQIDTRLRYRAQVGVLGSARLAGCGYAPEAMRRASLSMTTSLYWRRDWRIGARDTKFVSTLVDACRVTTLGVDATRTLRDIVNRQLAGFATQADTTIPQVADFKPLADSLWRSFLEPTALDSTESLWLLLEPEAVRVTPFVGAGPSLTTSMILYARPRVISGAKPSVRARPLPALALGTAPAAFSVPVSVELPFAEVAKRAGLLLAADPPSGGVRVDSVQVRGRGDTVYVDLDVSGSMRGRLSMTSRMRWDATARELRLDDLEWTLASKGLLSRMTSTLAAPFIGRAVRRATMGGRVPLGAQLDAVRTQLMVKLNGPVGPGAVMGSSVSDLRIVGVTSTTTAFVVRAQLTGTSGVWFR